MSDERFEQTLRALIAGERPVAADDSNDFVGP